MKILVTGAAGAIGSHLSERLAHDGHQVVGIDCFTDYYDISLKKSNAESVSKAGVIIHRIDLAVDDLAEVVQGVEVVYHCAAQPGISEKVSFETYERNNVIATHRLLEAVARTTSLKLFVNVATSSIYGAHANDQENTEPKPTSYYGVTKLAAEQLVMARYRESGFPGLSLRLFSVYGERERPDKLYHKLIQAITSDEPFPLYEGSSEHLRSYSYVGDIINGMCAVLENADACVGKIINLGTDHVHTTGEGIHIVEELMGKKGKYDTTPPRSGDQKETAADITKARALFDYNPSTTLRDGLAREIEWYRTYRK